ncbi:V-type proton ATPase subunit e1 isoform X1 [Phalaenopsis equestris]|uniref:V-type proton ATPase subunit e1 isoform X1 n=1 Tax=Phalaenopsis equestris TaxID=78828 RepID=UPI0009E2D4A2|nr:V-type proton ATPase subunit e1 isoform X1 [Phalaenopsis equestris]
MGFLVTSLIFLIAGVVASLSVRICLNRGPSTNLLHLTLILTATTCCWMIYRMSGRPTSGGHVAIHLIGKGHDGQWLVFRTFGRNMFSLKRLYFLSLKYYI